MGQKINLLYGAIEAINSLDNLYYLVKDSVSNETPLLDLLLNIWVNEHLVTAYSAISVYEYKLLLENILHTTLFNKIKIIVQAQLEQELLKADIQIFDVESLAKHLTAAIFIIISENKIDEYDKENWIRTNIKDRILGIKRLVGNKKTTKEVK